MQQTIQGRNWSELVRPRMSRSLAISTLLVAATLSLIRFQFGPSSPPDERAILEITLPQPVEVLPQVSELEDNEAATDVVQVSTPETETAAETDDAAVAGPTDVTSPARQDVAEAGVVNSTVDWYAELERVTAEIAARVAEPSSVNPHFDELRRVARIRYGKPKNDLPRPIWENVETDYLGRTILRDGDCFRIIDDPSVGNRYVFENFQQYIVYCTYQPSKPRDLPWVKEIQARYGYLRRDKDVLADTP